MIFAVEHQQNLMTLFPMQETRTYQQRYCNLKTPKASGAMKSLLYLSLYVYKYKQDVVPVPPFTFTAMSISTDELGRVSAPNSD